MKMSLKEIEKNMAFNRQSVNDRVKQYPVAALQDVKKQFDDVFKQARAVLKESFANVDMKRSFLMPLYYRLLDLAEISYQIYSRLHSSESKETALSSSNLEPKSNDEMGPLAMDMKKEPEIKPEKTEEKQAMKEVPQIKEKDGQVTLSLRGGKRENAGRKPIGVTRKVSLTFPSEGWEFLDSKCGKGKEYASVSDYFRALMGFVEPEGKS